YLNAIRTKTHTALFIKEIRKDGKGTVEEFTGAVKVGSNHTVNDLDDGGFYPKERNLFPLSYTEYPVSSLRLVSIYLIENRHLSIYEPLSSTLAGQGSVYYDPIGPGLGGNQGKYIFGSNVIDIHDVKEEN